MTKSSYSSLNFVSTILIIDGIAKFDLNDTVRFLIESQLKLKLLRDSYGRKSLRLSGKKTYAKISQGEVNIFFRVNNPQNNN